MFIFLDSSRFKKTCFVMVLLIFSSLQAYRKDLIFSHLGVKDGLSQGSVFCILKDHEGFMWFGTSDGLNRYDGLNFKVFNYKVDNPMSISHNFISCLYEDRQGILWVGTDGGGLNRMVTGLSRFTHYRYSEKDQDSVGSDIIRSVAQDGEGDLWVGTDRGLDRLKAGEKRFLHYRNDPRNPASIAGNAITFTIADREGRIWIGLGNSGVDRYDPETDRFFHYRHYPGDETTLAANLVGNACLAPDGMIWISHGNGWLSRLSPETGRVKRYVLGENIPQVGGICSDPGGNIWVCSGNGLYFLNPASGELINIQSDDRFPATLITNGLLAAYVDDTDILWVGTSFFGVNKANLKAKRFVSYTHDPTNPNTIGFSFVRGIYENRRGVLYIGGEGFDRFDRRNGNWRHFSGEKGNPMTGIRSQIYSICPNSDDDRDFLWISTNGNGIFTLDQNTERIRPYTVPGLNSLVVYSLYKDPQGFLWIGTDEGLYKYDQNKRETVRFELNKNRDSRSESGIATGVYWIMHDREGILWAGVRGKGLFSLDPERNEWTNFCHDPDDPHSLSSDLVTMMLETEAGDFWIGTYGGGVNRMNREKGTFEYITSGNGLPNDVVYGILEDDHGELWISTNKGLGNYHPETGNFRHFLDRDGLTGNEFNTQSFYRNRWTGELFFGGTNGLNAFFPNEILDDPNPPIVVLEDFKIFNRSVAPGPGSILKKPIDDIDSLYLSYRDSMLTFEFNGLHYGASSKNRFAYILEGFDKDWNYTDAFRRYATYTNLNPGRYTLRIKAANCDGVWNETGKILKVFISPPFWKTWWFQAFAVLFIVLTLFAAYHMRVRGLHKKKAELEETVALRTQELKEMSLSDPMTSLRNRRYVTEVVQGEIEGYLAQWKYVIDQGQRRDSTIPRSEIGLLLIDVDYFKRINDQYGHKAGDMYLSEFAKILRGNVRRDDVVVRWGGEEFLLILKNCQADSIAVIGEKIRKSVEAHEFLISETEKLRVKSSCCIGGVGFPFIREEPEWISFDQAVMLADMAMYKGKESGRNRTVYLEHTGMITNEEELHKCLSSLDSMEASGFVKIFTPSS